MEVQYTPTSLSHAGPPIEIRFEQNWSHSPKEWVRIRPRLHYLYITQNLPLRECMSKIGDEYGFLASESMYKKRIQAWGFSKSTRAAQKDKALALLVKQQAGVKSGTRISVRYDKLIRYAQQRVRAGQLDPKLLSQLQEYSTTPVMQARTIQQHASPDDVQSFSAGQIAEAIISEQAPSISLADPLAKLDLILRGCHAVFEKEKREWSIEREHSPDTIVRNFYQGMTQWQNKDFTVARVMWTRAAREFLQDVQNPSGAVVSRLSYLIGGVVWSEITDPVFLKFRDFMISAATENLGPTHAVTLMLESMAIDQSLEIQYAIWDVGLTAFKDVDIYHLYSMARQRWLFCKRNGMDDLALFYRNHAAGEMRKLGKMTEEMDRQGDEDLGVTPERSTSPNSAAWDEPAVSC